MASRSDRNNFTKDWKLMGVEFSARLILVGVAFIATMYMAASNWEWYTNDLGQTVKQPNWASEPVNGIIWLVWFAISGFVWHRHQVKHKEQVRMDLFYPVVLMLTFIMFTLFFEQRHFGAAKWAGVLNIIVMAYIIYEGFVTDGLVAGLLIAQFGILLYTVAQIWWFSKNECSSSVGWTERCSVPSVKGCKTDACGNPQIVEWYE